MSFSDLMSSSRGPGVIGTGIALVVLVGFALLYFLVFDESMQGGQKTIEAVIRDQAEVIDSRKSELVQLHAKEETAGKREGIRSEVIAATARAEAEAARAAELNQQKAALEQELTKIGEAWEAYKDQYRAQVWKEAQGQLLKEFKTVSGKVYTDAKVLGVDHTGMRVMVSSGPVNIKSEELPEDLKERYQLSEEKKAAILSERNQGVAVHEENVGIATRQQRIADVTTAIAEKKAAKQQAQQKLNAAIEAGPRHQAEISQQQSLISAERGKAVSRAPQMEQQLQQMRKKAEDTRNSISKLQSDIGKIDAEIATMDGEVKTLNQEIQKIRSEAKAKAATPNP